MGGHEHAFVAIEYFTKWVEAVTYAKITSKNVGKFLIDNIICKNNVPHKISDQGSYFRNEVTAKLKKYKI